MNSALKTVLIGAAAFAAGGGAVFLAMRDSSSGHPAQPPTAKTKTEAAATSVRQEAASPAPEKQAATVIAVRRSPEELQTVLANIQEATLEYSEVTLPRFEEWLRDPSREVRDAATEGLLQTGLSGGVPLLRAAAAAAHDTDEAAAQERAASILELPPATEAIIESRKNRPRKPRAEHFNLNERLGSDSEPAPATPANPAR